MCAVLWIVLCICSLYMSLWPSIYPFLFQPNSVAQCLRSVSYCELIILCWNCACVCFSTCLSVWGCVSVHAYMCVSFVTGKEMAGQGIISHPPHPDLIFLNALTPWLLLMHLQCQSHSFELQRWSETEKQRDWEVGAEEMGWGEGAWWLLFTLCACFKKILNAGLYIRCLCPLNFKIPLTPLFFFPPVCIQAASSHAAVSMAISICVRN